ncbi:MAG: glycerate kinase [Maribacter sp.]|uniref:glycerate kinase n=1 Tax=Maribacter sp. TaxID=1897614 RepID=UPI003C7817AB
MKFVIAPDKFKGSLSAFEFCAAVEEGLRMVFKEATILKMPLADGGDGTMAVVQHYIKGEKVSVMVQDPLFRPIEASYLFSKETKIAYIEMAEASGLKLLKEGERNCMKTTSLGTGELIADALQNGAQEIILGIGGSATNDGGMGMATALGFQFLDVNKAGLEPKGENLIHIKTIDASEVNPLLKNISVKVACDVTNPLYGNNGAAYIYAAQKGASPHDIERLDIGLKNYAKIVQNQFGIDPQHIEGAGAAGGMGAGCISFLHAQLTSGIDLIQELADFDTKIKGADWIITGEGKLDDQTLSGKTISGVIKSSIAQNIPVAALCGSLDISVATQKEMGLTYAASIVKGVSNLEQAIQASYDNLVHAAYNFASVLNFNHNP